MVQIRRIGLMVAAATLAALVAGAYAAEGIGLALIVIIAALPVIAVAIGLISIYEEERALPFAREERRKLR